MRKIYVTKIGVILLCSIEGLIIDGMRVCGFDEGLELIDGIYGEK